MGLDRRRQRRSTCVMQHSDAVSNLSLARCDAAGGDSAQKAVVLHHGHQHGEGVRGAVCRRGYVPDDGVQQWLHRRVLWRAARFGQHAVCPSLQCNVPGIECSQPMKMCITGLGIHPWQQSPLTLTLAGYLTIASSLSGQGQTLSGDANEMKLYAGVPVGLMHRAQGSPAAPPKHPDAQNRSKMELSTSPQRSSVAPSLSTCASRRLFLCFH